jgi:geranylgeranyl diphosphate synthase, type II
VAEKSGSTSSGPRVWSEKARPEVELQAYLNGLIRDVDRALDRFLPATNRQPITIHTAMRYSVFSGGKRLRPILCIAAAQACGGKTLNALAPACAVELMHTYSLVHDDLPAMDDDDLRRGRPTCHKVYGEAMAVLCGDALLTKAFGVLCTTRITKRYGIRDYIAEFAETGGSQALIGGQVKDLEAEGKEVNKGALTRIHEAKTAALLITALRFGAMTADAPPADLEALSRFGYFLVMAFQVVDDVLDVTQSTENLGKTAGKDEAAKKATFPSVMGLKASQRQASRFTNKALKALEPLGSRGDRLRQIAESMLIREF